MQDYIPQPGDIAACWGGDWQSRFISGVTAWPLSPPGLMFGPSHVAIISSLYKQSQTYWCESTTMTDTPCVVNLEKTCGVQAHCPRQRIKECKKAGGKVVIYRPAADYALDVYGVRSLDDLLVVKIAERTEYDLGSALLSGARLSARILNLFGYHDNDVFCSDLVATCLKKADLLDHDVASSLYTPAGLLRTLVRAGTYEEHMQL